MKINVYKWVTISSVATWLLLLVLLPFSLIILLSFFKNDPRAIFSFQLTVENYLALFDSIYLRVFLRSLIMGISITLLTLMIAYPFAYYISRLQQYRRFILLLFVIIPLWTSSLIRTYALIALIKTKGIINHVLLSLGIIEQPLNLLYSKTAVLIAMVYNLLPFMIIPLYLNLERINPRLLEAAQDLGANNVTIFRKIILPLSVPGIVAGSLMVMLPAMTIFYIPVIVGGVDAMLLGNVIQDLFLTADNWPLGSALSVLLIVLMSSLIVFQRRYQSAGNL